jgi:hypothetical protein
MDPVRKKAVKTAQGQAIAAQIGQIVRQGVRVVQIPLKSPKSVFNTSAGF